MVKNYPSVLKTFNYIKGYTQDDIAKTIIIVHPHWVNSTKGYRNFIKKAIETLYDFSGYTFNIMGNCSYKGIRILETIEQHFKKLLCIEKIDLNIYNAHSNYVLTIKVKDK